MSAMETTRFSIVKLGNSNYNIWKFKIEMLLSKDCLWSKVEEEPPDTITEHWSTKNRQAMATISLSVEDGQLIHIRDCKTAREMWLALQRLHESTNLNSKLYLLRKLYRAKLENEREMAAHIDQILDLVAQLRSIGELIPDNHIAALMLCSLPETYSPLIAALEARPDSDMTVEFVKGRLMDEYRRRKENGAFDDTTSEKLYKTTRGFQNFNKTKKETRECYNCGKIGHLKKDCWISKNRDVTKHKARKVSKTGYSYNKQKKNDESNDQDSDHLCFITDDDSQLNSWCIDSGATSHMTGNKEFFKELSLLQTQETVCVADGRSLRVEGKGSGLLVSNFNNTCKLITINDVLYVPGLDSNLLSVKRLTQLGYKLKFEGLKCNIFKGSELITTAKLENNLYKLHHMNQALKVKHNVHDNCIHIWHRRFGHRSAEAIQKLLRDKMVNHLNISSCNINGICKECIEGKMVVKSFPKHSDSKADKPYQILHSDLCGPMKTPTPSGNRYIATITDDFSRYTEVFLLKTKDEVNRCIINYMQKWNNYFGRKPLKFRSDCGGEFINQELTNYFMYHGISRQLAAPYSPQQNGVAERRNRSILEMTRCLLFDAKLDNKYWGEAVMTAVYLQNRLPTKGCVEVTPYEAWYDRKPSVGHLRIFGSKAYTRRPGQLISKLEPRTEMGIFVGYSSEAKAYRILIPETNRIRLSRSVICEEVARDEDTIEVQVKNEEQDNLGDLQGEYIDEPKSETKIPKTEEPDIEEPLECQQESGQLRKSQRSTKGIAAEKLSYLSEEAIEFEPGDWNEMVKLPPSARKKWLNAVSEELNSFNKNNVWSLVTLPENKTTVGTKWMFKLKKDSKGNIIKYKARLVAKGYSQVEGTDYEDTYAPVVKHTTLRTLLIIAASKKLITRHMDVKTAFLYGDLHEEIYIDQPEGQQMDGKEGLVYKLNKAMYGLKQAAFEWNLKINDILIQNGYSRGNADPCLYSKLTDNITSYILIYVDDLLVCSNSNEEICMITNTLKTKFEMKDLGHIRYYLGIDIQQKDDNYIILQTDKINQMVKEFKLQDSNISNTPMDCDYLKQRNIDFKMLPNNNSYRQAVGALLHLASVSRPDISLAVGLLGRNTNQPNNKDWMAAKHIIKYLKGTPNLGVILSGTSTLTLSGYVDSDWAGDSSDRKSTSGYVFFLGNSPISWSSRKQTCVSLSSTEAEYVAAASACQELLWLKILMNDFGIEQNYPIVINEDNQGCIKLAETNRYHARSKHIDIKFHFLRDLSQKEVVKLTYCSTEEMVADLLTKPLGRQSFLALSKKLGLGTGVC